MVKPAALPGETATAPVARVRFADRCHIVQSGRETELKWEKIHKSFKANRFLKGTLLSALVINANKVI